MAENIIQKYGTFSFSLLINATSEEPSCPRHVYPCGSAAYSITSDVTLISQQAWRYPEGSTVLFCSVSTNPRWSSIFCLYLWCYDGFRIRNIKHNDLKHDKWYSADYEEKNNLRFQNKIFWKNDSNLSVLPLLCHLIKYFSLFLKIVRLYSLNILIIHKNS